MNINGISDQYLKRDQEGKRRLKSLGKGFDEILQDEIKSIKERSTNMLNITDIKKDNTKASFVKELCEFYVCEVDPLFGIDDLDYIVEGSDEWVYVTFKNGSKKRFSVNCDNNRGILLDFVDFLKNFNEYAWII